jgi:hypothetical protein
MSLADDSYDGIKATAAALALQLVLKFARVGERKKLACPNQSPRPPGTCPTRHSTVMLTQPPRNLIGQTDVIFPSAVLQDVHTIVQREEKSDCRSRQRSAVARSELEMVAGVGFEPTTFRL